MPNKVVTVRRWEVVGAFVLIVLISILLAWWGDYRDDQLERRVQRNTVTNEQQDQVRRELLRALQQADLRACHSIEDLKDQARQFAIESYANLEANAEAYGFTVTPALRRQALANRDRLLVRFAAREC